MLKSRIRYYLNKITSLMLIGAIISTLTYDSGLAKTVSTKKTKYVKEVALGYGKTEKEARNWLKDNGYTPVNGDLNDGTQTTGKTVNVVIMGYKTTTNIKEALTDIALMPMDGKFRITDMDTIVENQKKIIDDGTDNLIALASEYRINYKKAIKSKAKGKNDFIEAISIHDMLNKIKEDDSKTGMGDVLLKDYNNKNECKNLRNIFIQANRDLLGVIENMLLMAGGDSEKTWIEEMSDANKKSTFFERTIARLKSKKRAKTEIDKKYGDKLDYLEKDIENLRAIINENEQKTKKLTAFYEKKGDDITEKEFNTFFGLDKEIIDYKKCETETALNNALDNNKKLAENNAEFYNYINNLKLIDSLMGFKIKDMSIYDFIMNGENKLKINYRYELAAFLECLSTAQYNEYAESADTYTMIKSTMMSDNSIWANKHKLSETINDTINMADDISIYDGVNRDIYKGKVAITEYAGRSTHELNIYQKNTALTIMSYVGLTASVIASVVGVTLIVHGVKWFLKSNINFTSLLGRFTEFVGNTLKLGGENTLFGIANTTGKFVINPNGINAKYVNSAQFERLARLANGIVISIGVILAVASIVIATFSIIRIVNDVKKNLKGDYSVEIPKYIADLYSDDDGDEYVYYTAAICNRNDNNMTGIKEDKNLLHDYADINGDTGKCWVAMYTTRDKLAGNPIIADSFSVDNKNASYKDGYRQIHSFNERNTGFNLTSINYNFNDSEGGTYISFKSLTDKETLEAENAEEIIAGKDAKANASDTGSIFNSSKDLNPALLIICTFTGILIGASIVLFTNKRKKNHENNA